MAAKRKKRRSTSTRSTNKRRPKQSTGVSPVVAMLFGLAVGLSVAFAIYVKDRQPEPVATTAPPASLQSSIDQISVDPIDHNGENAEAAEPAEKSAEKRFTFYDILPNFEIVTPDEEPDIARDAEPQAVVEPGVYVLQAGSFSTNGDADRRRAELALHGIESHIQRVKVNDRNYHRVYIGPTEDLDELNLLRSRLRVAKIDVFRIRLSD
jgi:cell division protein FtsN